MIIPIIVICYNNYKYVQNTINQLIGINRNLEKHIIILDNKSTCTDTLYFLKSVGQLVLYNRENKGPWITKENNREIYDLLPDKFILTDPDLEFNSKMPKNFIDILVELSEKYKCEKVGFALDIDDFDKMFTSIYCDGRNIKEWESQWWINKIQNNEYELYNSPIDTTFSLITKNASGGCIRIAGNFTAKHLPWYSENKIYNIYENFLFASNQTEISTISKIVLEYIANNFIKIEKNNEIFFINNKSAHNQNFDWQNNLFIILDKMLTAEKNFIEIGAGCGSVSIYAARKSKQIYSVENDLNNFRFLQENCKNNLDNYNLSFSKISTLESFLNSYNILYSEISLININMNGKEEYILNELHKLYTLHRIPFIIKFNYVAWQDKNIDRFTFLTEINKNNIKINPCVTLIFS
jgi:hypothetical protein